MKKKIIPIILFVLFFIIGGTTTIIGVTSMNSGTEQFYTDFDPFNITDGDVGKAFCCVVQEEEKNEKPYPFWIYTSNKETKNFVLTTADNGSKEVIIAFEIPSKIPVSSYSHLLGIVRKGDAGMNERISTSIDEYADYMQQNFADTEDAVNADELAELHESVSPYYIEVIEGTNGEIYVWIGGAVMVLALIALLITLFGKKFLIAFGVAAAIAIVILLLCFIGKIRTMMSVKEVSDGLYTMTCHYDYRFDEFLDADISTIDEFIGWMTEEYFFGLPIELDTSNFGCAAFSCTTPEGQHLFGRNFDYDETDALIVYTEPKDGYASYGVTDLRFFGIGEEGGLEGNSVPAKALMLAAPYVTMDGINEAGVGVGILQLDIDELHQENGKSDLLIFAAIRGILDQCATVDEAVALLDHYDIHSFLDHSYHLFITDKTGKSVIVEWTDDETYIVEDTACTNDVMSSNKFYDPEWLCERYDTIKTWLNDKNGILTKDEAMQVASDASSQQDKFNTEWSCVYNLDDFTMDICIDREYEIKYSFAREYFTQSGK